MQQHLNCQKKGYWMSKTKRLKFSSVIFLQIKDSGPGFVEFYIPYLPFQLRFY